MKISVLGFPQAEVSKLIKILPLARNQQYTLQPFNIAALPDVLLLFGDVASYSSHLARLPVGHRIKLVIVAKQGPEQGIYYHLPFPLVASRVLRVLETLSQAAEPIPAPLASKPAEFIVSEAIKPIEVNQEAPGKESEAVALTMANTTVVENNGNEALPVYKVLIVDDSLPMQKAIAMELEKLAATVQMEFAGSGEEALEKTADKEYDFIFLDIMMPGIDGFETCSQMRKRPNMKKTPIIMLSAKTSPLDEVKGVIAGCTTYLMKPIVHEEFQKVIIRITKWVDNYNARGKGAGV
jgi:twitching motility two-component system response regulator PilG